MPAAMWFIQEVADRFVDMCDPNAWVQDGSVTVDQAVEASNLMSLSFQPMIGVIFPFVTTDPPLGSLECNGATYNRVDYPTLYAQLDAVFIVDADTFIVPDLRGRTVIGAGTGSGLSPRAVGAIGGEETHQIIISEMPSHSHTDVGHSHAEITATPVVIPVGLGAAAPSAIPGAGVTGVGSANLTNTGGDQAHNNMQPFTALKYCIVAG